MSLFGRTGYAYHGSVRRYTVAFGVLFSDMLLMRGEDFIKVPLRFGTGNLYEKMPQTNAEREQSRVREILPSASFYITDIQRDSTRQTNPHHTLDMGLGLVVAARVPHNITFELAVRNKNLEDHLQLLEQITTAFDPTYTAKMRPIDNSDKSENVVIVLDSFSVDDNSDSQVDDGERRIEAVYSFTVKGYFYKAASKADVVTEVVYGTGVDENDLSTSVFVSDKATQANLVDYDALGKMVDLGLVETRVVNPDVVAKTTKVSKRKMKPK